jgi:hypothetical protein
LINLPCISTRADNPPENVLLVDCTFAVNLFPQISGSGGVIYCPAGSTVSLSISNCLFYQCSATDRGGAIYSASGGSVEIFDSNSTFCSVTASNGEGGSIYLQQGSSHDLKNILAEDSTHGYNGAIQLCSPSGDITLDTISIIRGKSTGDVNSFDLRDFTCTVYLSNCLGKDGTDPGQYSSWFFYDYSLPWNVSFEYCFFENNMPASGAKDMYFYNAIGTRLSKANNFVETYSQSGTPHSYINGQTWSEAKPDWIPTGNRP